MMAQSGKIKSHLQGLRVAVTLIFLCSLTILPSISVSLELSNYNSKKFDQDKNVLGSRPPRCVNKCKNCWPCRATLVIPPHENNRERHKELFHGEDDTYYLLSWKCRCGNKFYQP